VSRRKGRVLAFQALYSHDVGGVSIDDLLTFSWVNKDESPAEDYDNEAYTFARLLITGTMEHITQIDDLVKQYLSAHWEFDRVNKVSLAILRMSVYSLLYQRDTNPSIVIDEAINIAKDFGADDSFKFINAVLDKISKAAQVPKEG
jgi:transcription antitermination protein NusB